MENEIFRDDNVAKSYIRLSLPLVFSMVVSLIYNLADTFFVARTNDTNIVAGVSLGMPIFTLLMAVGNIFGQGGSSLISRMLGQRDEEGARRASAFCFYVTIFTGVVFAALMMLFRTPMLYLLGASENTFAHASDYYTYLALGAPVIMLTFIHSNLLRSEGMSRESMTGTILGSLINIVLDPIFISTLGWNAAGAAIATVIGNLGSDVYFAVIVAKKSRVLSLDPKKIRIPARDVRQIFGIGIPAAIVNVMQSVSVILTNQMLLPYGDEKIAAMGIVLKVSMIALLLLTGFAFGGQPLFGYYYGAGDKERLWKLFRFCLKFISAIAVALSAILFAAAPLLMRCFMENANIVGDGTVMLRWQVSTMLFVGVVLLITIVFQSTGKVAGSFILSVCRQGVVFLAALAVARHFLGYTGIIAAQALSDVLSAAIAGALFYKLVYREIR